MYIYELPEEVQEAIRENYEDAGLTGNDLEQALSKKVNVSDVIEFGFWN